MLKNKFNASEVEPRLYKAWEESGAFKPRKSRPIDTPKDNYSIIIPPPNVTGSLHMGHAVNNTIQDILIRYNRMLGKAVLWQPGTDHAGIATQMVVERKLSAENKQRKNMTRDEFLGHVWKWKSESGGNINQQLRRLGSSCDWSREKFTLGDPKNSDDNMSEAVTKAFVDMYNKGLIYRDKRLVNWDPHFQTAISDLEVENIEKDGSFWHFKYPLAGGETYTYIEKDDEGNILLSEVRDYISIATTRPETMLGDGAVAVHPDDKRYASIIGKKVKLPISNRLIPIISDEYPDPDFGSGAVKITGAHDFNDYEVAKRHNIPLYSLMDERGVMVDSEFMPKKYVGMDRFKARKEVVKDIEEEGCLLLIEDKKVMQPFGDRSGVIIEPMLTDQWFVAADKLSENAINKVNDGSIKFVPDNWKKTYDHWMNDIQPWCISRQLWWGHQIPVWYGYAKDISKGETSNIKNDDDKKQLIEFVAQSDSEAISMAEAYYGCTVKIDNNKGKAENKIVKIWRDQDVLDTWFSSGLWSFSTMGWPNKTEELSRFYPTSTLVTAFDIIFFWVARMIMLGLHFMDDVPFNDIYIHALVLDEQGKKMSKSIGNTLDPLDLIDGVEIEELISKRTRGLKNPELAPKIAKATRKQYPKGFEAYGADALRFTLASMAGQGRNIRLSVDRIAGYRNFGTKLWSAATFGQLNRCNPSSSFSPKDVNHVLNKWIVSEVSKTIEIVTSFIESYRFNDSADEIYKFSWDTFCSWYLELVKPILSDSHSTYNKETRETFAWVFDQILKLLHPFMPFITEELWHNLSESRDKMLIVTEWPALSGQITDESSVSDVKWLQMLVTNLRSVRADMNIPPSKMAPLLVLSTSLDERLNLFVDQLKPLARVSGISLSEVVPRGALQTVVEGVTYAIPLEGLLDKTVERDRLNKEISKIEVEISKIDNKLSNHAFVSNAPEKVVVLQKDRKLSYLDELEKLNLALVNLN
ncbi:MAG: valine--tRNA ligase [Hellea sp.]|nr:valine--tRNA ligase [Hellea sp.]